MTIRRHGCHNRPPIRDAITVQDGLTGDGRKITKHMPHVMSRDCRHDLRQTDPGCKGYPSMQNKLFLTDEEMVELTGAKRKSNQIRWLIQHRYPHETNANGAPKVLRCYLERRLGESTKTAGNQPNFGALKKAS